MNFLGGSTMLWRGGLNLGWWQGASVNLPPVAGDDAATTVAGGTVKILILANDTDPEGGALTVTEASALHGSVSVEADGALSYTAPQDFSGIDTITYTVVDSIGNSDEATVTVTITTPENLPPVAGDDVAEVTAGKSLTIPVLENDVDPEGEDLTVTEASAVHGSVTIEPYAMLRYTAPQDFSGTDTITYTIADPSGRTDEGAVTVTVSAPENLPPVAGDDAAVVTAGGTVTIPVLANDTDPEGGALTVTGASAVHGSVSVEADGTLSYTAPQDFSGTDTITYTIADPQSATGEGTVTIDVFVLSVSQGEEIGEFVVTSAPGELTVSVTEPADYAGDYIVRTVDLADGPSNLVPPRISGAGAVGESLTALAGLWAFDEAGAPLTLTRQWLRAGDAIEGATDLSYVVTQADAGQNLALRETAATLAGARQAESSPLAVAEGGNPSWTPAGMSDLAVWFDAADASTITSSGDRVTQWGDKSGHGTHAVISANLTQGPTTGVASVGGLNALEFGTDNGLEFNKTISTGGPALSVFVAFGAWSSAGRQILNLGSNGSAYVRLSGHDTADELLLTVKSAGLTHASARSAQAAGMVGAFHPMQTSAANTDFMWNGEHDADVFPDATGGFTVGGGKCYIGRSMWNGSGEAGGPIGEILIFTTLLSTADRQKVEGYLAHKWGFAGLLPSGHSYKTSAPS